MAVVIPCYNEEESIAHLAATLHDAFHPFSETSDVEYCFVDDGSTDRTYELLQRHFGHWPGERSCVIFETSASRRRC